MRCWKCGAQLDDDSVFCIVCGAKQDENMMRYSGYDTVPEETRQKSPVLLIVAILAAVIILGGIGGFFVYKTFVSENDAVEEEITEEEEAVEKEVDLSNVDINAVEDPEAVLKGKVSKNSADKWIITLNGPLTVYAEAEEEDKVLEDVEFAFIMMGKSKEEIMESIPDSETIKLEGELHIEEDNLYIKVDKICDASGTEITKAKEEEEVKEAKVNSEYIIPDSDRRLLGYDDVKNLSLQEINYAKNEIYARHGRRFKSPELQNYFNSKSWYSGTIAPENFSESMLSNVEQQNAKYLSDTEYGRDSRGYLLDQ